MSFPFTNKQIGKVLYFDVYEFVSSHLASYQSDQSATTINDYVWQQIALHVPVSEVLSLVAVSAFLDIHFYLITFTYIIAPFPGIHHIRVAKFERAFRDMPVWPPYPAVTTEAYRWLCALNASSSSSSSAEVLYIASMLALL